MRIFRFCIALFAVLATFSAHANFDTQDFGAELIFQVEEEEKGGPFRFELEFDAIGRSNFNDPSRPGEHLSYSEAEIEGRFIYLYNEKHREGADIGLIYETSNIRWKNNPFFEQENFHNATLSLSLFSQRWKAWFLHAQVNMNVNTDHVSFFQYVTWDLLLVNRYTYCPDIGIFTGFIAQTGMKMDRIYPILGVDWQATEKWFINAVFPISISAIYSYDKNIAFSLALRTFETRQRLGKGENLSQGLLRYTNSGLELGINWENCWITTNVHAGYTFGGRIRLATQHNARWHHYDFDPAPYVGGELSLRF